MPIRVADMCRNSLARSMKQKKSALRGMLHTAIYLAMTIATQIADTNRWHKSVTQIVDTNRWHKSLTQIVDTNRWHKSLTQTVDTNRWHKSVTQIGDTNRWHKSVTEIGVCSRSLKANWELGRSELWMAPLTLLNSLVKSIQSLLWCNKKKKGSLKWTWYRETATLEYRTCCEILYHDWLNAGGNHYIKFRDRVAI